MSSIAMEIVGGVAIRKTNLQFNLNLNLRSGQLPFLSDRSIRHPEPYRTGHMRYYTVFADQRIPVLLKIGSARFPGLPDNWQLPCHSDCGRVLQHSGRLIPTGLQCGWDHYQRRSGIISVLFSASLHLLLFSVRCRVLLWQ
jgi:hypothetical protein